MQEPTTQERTQARLNGEYSELCKQLGDLAIKGEALNAQIATVKEKIKALDIAAPAFHALAMDLLPPPPPPPPPTTNGKVLPMGGE